MVMGRQTGGFDSRVNTAVGPIPKQIEKADFNRDGFLDLAILSVGTTASQGQEYKQSLHVLQGNGAGGFVSPFTIALNTTDVDSRFAAGDLNGDGWPDLALLEPAGNRIRTAWNKKTAAIGFQEGAAAIDVGPGGRRIASGDLDGDTLDDLVVASAPSYAEGLVQVFLMTASGGSTAGGSQEIPALPTCLALGKIDGDGALDVAVGGDLTPGGEVYLIAGSGTGGLKAPRSASLPGIPSDIDLGDLNGDGLRDMVLSIPDLSLLVSVLMISSGEERFIRGDGNGDEKIDISDPIGILFHQFAGTPTNCLEALDANDDGTADLSDPVFLLSYLFLGGPALPPPFPEAGKDTGTTHLGCNRT